MISIWFNSFIETVTLILLSSLIAVILGLYTSIFAWRSGSLIAYFAPMLVLSVPPWLFAFYISEYFLYIDPVFGASVSLGLCSSPYCHAFMSSSLISRAHATYEAITVINGKSIRSILYSIYPSLKVSIIPSIAIVSAEVLSDFGVSNYFGLNTLTMVSYNMWATTWSLSASMHGVLILMGLALALSLIKSSNSVAVKASGSDVVRKLPTLFALLPPILILAFCYLTSIYWIYLNGLNNLNGIFDQLLNTLFLISIIVILNIAISVIFLITKYKKIFKAFGVFTYSLPGVVIGIVLIALLGNKVPLIVLLIAGISIKYFGLLINALFSYTENSQLYIETINVYSTSWQDKIKKLFNFVFPSLLIGLSILTLDILRELPISIVLHPIGFETFSMNMNHLAKTENPTVMGAESLTVMIIGLLLSIIILWSTNDRNKKLA